VKARITASPIQEFPGPIPVVLDIACSIQDEVINQWPDLIGSWKLGRIPPELQGQFGCDRLAVPIFARQIHKAAPGEVPERAYRQAAR
jgi:2-keto-4-pentenoate hydratase